MNLTSSLLRAIAQAALVAVALLVVILPTSRLPVIVMAFWLLFLLVASEYLWRNWRAGWLRLTVGQVHDRIMRRGPPEGGGLELLAISLSVVAMLVLSIRD